MSCDQEMMCEMDSDFKWHFESLADFFFDELLPTEQASLSYDAEDTYFLRMNHAKVRQNGFVRRQFRLPSIKTRKPIALLRG